MVVQKDNFRYLGSVLQKDGDIDEDVRHKISAGWLKWCQTSNILYDKRVPQKLKGKFYRTTERIDGPRGGGELGLFQISRIIKSNINLCNTSKAPIHQPDN